jgi:heavy metal sensor kinase
MAAASVVVLGGFAAVVYARAHRLAHRGTEESLRLQATALSALLEVGKDGIEYEAPAGGMPGYEKADSGAFASITDESGKVVVRSPSLGGRDMPPAAPVEDGPGVVEEVASGPLGRPVTMITRAFLVKPEPGANGGDAATGAPPPPPRRFRIQVALDSRGRDAELAGLAWFLGGAGGLAVLLSLGAGLLVTGSVLRPVDRMAREAAAITPGESGQRLHAETAYAEMYGLAATLNAALDRLDEALRRQRRFTADASHELRTPVSVLLAGTELALRRPRTAEEYHETLQRQLRTIQRMKGIVENLLVLARADAVPEEVPLEPVPLREVLESVCEEFGPMAEGKSVRLERDLRGDATVRGSRRLLVQMAGNLLCNAVKFTPAGGTVTVRLAVAPGEARLSFEDTGPGIPEEHRAHVFQRFYRVREGKDGAEGAGLGLSIVDWIVRRHGGGVAVEDGPAGGTAVRVRLPRQPANG